VILRKLSLAGAPRSVGGLKEQSHANVSLFEIVLDLAHGCLRVAPSIASINSSWKCSMLLS